MLRYSIKIKDIITERKAFISFLSYESAMTFLDVSKGKNRNYSLSEVINCGTLTNTKPQDTKLVKEGIEEIYYVWSLEEIKILEVI